MTKIPTTLTVAVALCLAATSVQANCPGETPVSSDPSSQSQAEGGTWHWQTNPSAYQPDDICDYCQDYRTDGEFVAATSS